MGTDKNFFIEIFSNKILSKQSVLKLIILIYQKQESCEFIHVYIITMNLNKHKLLHNRPFSKFKKPSMIYSDFNRILEVCPKSS